MTIEPLTATVFIGKFYIAREISWRVISPKEICQTQALVMCRGRVEYVICRVRCLHHQTKKYHIGQIVNLMQNYSYT